MRMRTALTALAALSIGLAGQAAAKTDVLDGKKVKKVVSITQTRQGAATPYGDPTAAQVAACKLGIDCDRLDFIYKPAKGVKGDLTVFAKWYFAGTTDVDIYLLDGAKVLGSCGGQQGNERHFDLPASALKPGKKYTAVAWYSRSTGEGLTLQVSMPPITVAPYETEGTPPHTVRVDGRCA